VFFEETYDVESAITKEKQIKKWNRQWKIELIEKKNPEWEDLYSKIVLNGFPIRAFGNDKW